jgi:hypothetical protein
LHNALSLAAGHSGHTGLFRAVVVATSTTCTLGRRQQRLSEGFVREAHTLELLLKINAFVTGIPERAKVACIRSNRAEQLLHCSLLLEGCSLAQIMWHMAWLGHGLDTTAGLGLDLLAAAYDTAIVPIVSPYP